VNLQAAALVWLAEGRPAVVVEVAAHRGSVPRETGTRMLVAAGQVLGTIGSSSPDPVAFYVQHANRLKWAFL